jgi:hypothetical protein
MGAPTSAILAEAYIQRMEHKLLYPVLRKHQIIGYFRYIDDIRIIYNKNKTNIAETLTEFIKQKKNNIKFTIEKEQHNPINILDLTIHQKSTKPEFAMYREPTQTATIMPSDSCHPYEHKMLIINYLMNRVNTYPITNEAKTKKLNIYKTCYITTNITRT